MNIKEAVEELKQMFCRARFDPAVHLGLGDIRLSFGRQEEIVEMLEEALKEKGCDD